MLHLAPSTPSKRKKRCITTNPLVTTRRFDQRRFGIAAEATMLASYRFGFHAVVRHGLSLFVALEVSWLALAHQMHRAADGSILSDHVHLNLTSTPLSVPMRACERAQTMSQLSKAKYGRNQWKAKAKQRSDDNRYLRKQLARVKAERDRAKQALKDSQGRLRQLESQAQTVAVRSKVDVVWLSLRLFLEVRISFRAVSRVLHVLAADLGIERAPCAQSVINWAMRLSMVRIEGARERRGLPLPQAPFSNGLIWMIDLSIALGSGKI
jgi:hypothetical protein